MKILVSVFQKDAECGRSVAEELQSSGHEIFLCAPDQINVPLAAYRLGICIPLRQTSEAYWRAYRRLVNERLYTAFEEFKPDFVLVIGGEDVAAETVARMRRARKLPVAAWVTDEHACASTHNPFRWMDFSAYTHLFVVDELWAQSLQMFPTPKIYLPWAGNPLEYQPLRRLRDIDILFLGDLFPPHPHTVSGYGRARVLDMLYKKNLHITSIVPHAKKMLHYFPRLKEHRLIDAVHSPKDLNVFFNRSKLIFYINPLLLKADFSSTVFNVALSGSFLITDRKRNGARLFDSELVDVTNVDESAAALRFFLDHPAERERRAERVRAIAARRHTYRERAHTILRTIGNGLP